MSCPGAVTRTDESLVGLTTAEAQRRLQDFGPNATPEEPLRPLRLIASKFIAPVPCLLEAAIALQLVLGEYVEASIIGALLAFNAALGFLHESRAQATIAALKSRLALSASVRREGDWKSVPAAELVPGDIIKLSLGAVVAADVRLLEGSVLLDQSMLTGESLPIEADAGRETYAGALVRRGEAIAEVTATGARTKFGRTAELVRTAHATSSQQRAVFRIVRNLAGFNGAVSAIMVCYAYFIGLPFTEIIPLVLVVVLASIPVALPATFTLATAIGAQALAKRGVLPTRLSAVDEAGTMDVLCSDKTGTLTQNELAVTEVQPMPGYDRRAVLSFAALASSDGGPDPVDAAVRAAASAEPRSLQWRQMTFVPFDPALKMSQASVADGKGEILRVVKGAFAAVAKSVEPPRAAAEAAAELEARGLRVLAVALGSPAPDTIVGLIALSDPPRPDAKALIDELRRLGVEVVMVSGDAAATASVVAKEVGLEGAAYPGGTISELRAQDFAIFAGVLPEDKYRLVKALQGGGRTVGMCGDGANDAPALRQAQIGIAVSTATDVAKSAAGIVLTEPGLAGIVAAVKEGRITFQRILTYTLRSIVAKTRQVLFLAIGLVMIGHAVLTPMLMVISMITGDFLAMSSTTDNVVPSPRPNTWRIDNLTIAGVVIGLFDLVFCAGALAVGQFALHLDLATLRTLTLATIAYNGQAVFYVARERRRLWSSRPSLTIVLSSIADLSIITTLSVKGFLMAPLSPLILGGLFLASLLLALVLDQIKLWLFARLRMV
jgi:H+-transporting ATPase